jgi:sugar phosphate isomerase/epimerase
MLIGAMNHPARDPIDEIRRFAAQGFEFIDLTLEPPTSASWKIKPAEIKRVLADAALKVVGHTAYYLPLASPFESLRRAALDEVRRCLTAFGEIGAKWVNLHPDGHAPLHELNFVVERNLASIHELLPDAKAAGVGLMIENLPGRFNSAEQLAAMLDPIPELGLHLDIGHANLQTEHNTTGELIRRFGNRLRHVHLHDNKGGWADLHLPLGSGTVNAREHIHALRASGYDSTITLEVFTPDPHYLLYSRDLLRAWWHEPVG